MLLYIFVFILPQDLRAPLANRHVNLPHDWYVGYFYNSSPEFGGPPKRILRGQNMTLRLYDKHFTGHVT